MKLRGRYFYSSVFLVVTVLLFAIAGFLLSNIGVMSGISLSINPVYTLVWRCTVYSLLWWIWKPLITKRIGNHTVCDSRSIVKKSRVKLLIAMMLFELLIVQNSFWAAVVTIEGLFHGR